MAGGLQVDRIGAGPAPDANFLILREILAVFAISPGNDKWDQVVRCLLKLKFRLGAFSGMFLLAAASMDQKILRDGDRQLPLFGRHSAESKNTARLRKLR